MRVGDLACAAAGALRASRPCGRLALGPTPQTVTLDGLSPLPQSNLLRLVHIPPKIARTTLGRQRRRMNHSNGSDAPHRRDSPAAAQRSTVHLAAVNTSDAR